MRILGVTGHGVSVPGFHPRSLAMFDFNSVLLPYSYMMMRNPSYAEGVRKVLELCKERNIAVQTIKSITRSPWQDVQQDRATWYRPLEEPADIELAVHGVRGNDRVFLNTPRDLGLRPRALRAAQTYRSRPTDEQMEALFSSLLARAPNSETSLQDDCRLGIVC